MLKKILFIGILVLICNISVKADFEDSYMKIEYTEINENGEEHAVGSSGWNCGKNFSMSSLYYKTYNNGVGVKGGSYADYDDVYFEMPYHLRLIKQPDRLILQGVFRAFALEDSIITSGERKVIDQNIEYNKPIVLSIKPSEKSSETRVTITLLEKEIKPEISFRGPISLRTSFVGMPGRNTNTKGVITERTEFSSGSGKLRDDGYFEQAKMLTEILLPNYPENLDKPFQTIMLFKRIYKIDTLYISEKEFSVDVTYTSEYKKKIEIIPGKTLMLVFPPDTPSVRGFNREDTLFIKP